MKRKPVVPRAQAVMDVNAMVDSYLSEATEATALRFIDALEEAYAHIGSHPATGSPRYAHELDLPGLRCWSFSSFPQVVFYVECPGHVDVWRVLHGHRDIPAWMAVPES